MQYDYCTVTRVPFSQLRQSFDDDSRSLSQVVRMNAVFRPIFLCVLAESPVALTLS